MVIEEVGLVQIGALAGIMSSMALLLYVLDVIHRLLSHMKAAPPIKN